MCVSQTFWLAQWLCIQQLIDLEVYSASKQSSLKIKGLWAMLWTLNILQSGNDQNSHIRPWTQLDLENMHMYMKTKAKSVHANPSLLWLKTHIYIPPRWASLALACCQCHKHMQLWWVTVFGTDDSGDNPTALQIAQMPCGSAYWRHISTMNKNDGVVKLHVACGVVNNLPPSSALLKLR